MNTAKQVDSMIAQWKSEGMSPEEIAWRAALACEGWPYVYGAWGAECTVAERKKRYRDDHPTIKTKCKAFEGGTCVGCQWFPGGERVRCFDCRGFTDWVLKNAGVIDLKGEGATSQWNTASNWSAKGPISTIPGNTLVCLFVEKDKKMQHTGLGYNNETVECSAGVQHFTSRKAKWTHWAIPKSDVPVPTPTPKPEPVPAGYAEVTGKRVALREDPSIRATVIMRIDTGEQVRLEPEPDEWDYVSYKGRKGWMMKKFLKEGGQ